MGAGCQRKSNDALMIAVSANMQFAITELVGSFEKETGIECQTVISSSGKLTAQIIEGAPFDILVSADMKYPNELHQSGLTASEPQIYAYGKLVMWTLTEEIEPSFAILEDKNVRHIAIANPKIAPYGVAAIQALEHHGILDDLGEKLVYGESIAQTNQFIFSGAAEIGFTAKSVVLSEERGRWKEVDSLVYSPIAQGVVIIKNDNGKFDPARRFADYLFSSQGRKILNRFGYVEGTE